MQTFKDYLKSNNYITEEGNVYYVHSGIKDVVIYASVSQGQHGPRIKVSNKKGKFDNGDNYSVSLVYPFEIVAGRSKLSKSTQEIIKIWIKKNINTLLSFWNHEYPTTDDFLSDLRKVTDDMPSVEVDP